MRVGFGDSHGVKEQAPSCYSPLTIFIIPHKRKKSSDNKKKQLF